MPYRLIKADETHTSHWAGGSTTELLISPTSAKVADRDFHWRISSARVERDGPFSDFSGYRRLLLVLEGKGMSLDWQHGEDSGQLLLTPDSPAWQFEGEAKVNARLLEGPISDFNLICNAGMGGELLLHAERHSLESGTSARHGETTVPGQYGIYLHSGALTIEGMTPRLSPGDLLLAQQPLEVRALSPSLCVLFFLGL
ncbi:HutD/Ves family protein [Shewanella cyperi]|uniref:HutD family protein n=1 Tax=Shewanella cyperi TaxID=2814292 RepID=A0A975AK98_9GAMM|nr:HutD family protein [Shewanella cyperi]QSX30162.1 HutD family protein [Shewanella cyperi]QSX40936.1 HutD family protein [Shewanella cyperi]